MKNPVQISLSDAQARGYTAKLLWEDEDGEYQIERNDTPIKINVKITTR